MIIRALDKNSDWVFGKGANSYKREKEAIIQNVETRILEWKNDCFFNFNAGVDWYNRLVFKGSQATQKRLLEAELTAIIKTSFGVANVIFLEASFNRVDRKVIIRYKIATSFSQEEAIEGNLTIGF